MFLGPIATHIGDSSFGSFIIYIYKSYSIINKRYASSYKISIINRHFMGIFCP